ncbi:nucleoside monophosphate kinase [Candidatus Woesearchaeota archaeon]|nr:MAG: nucleoside monophosphate kinase [Candidatus Woesearchaeota archaeon]
MDLLYPAILLFGPPGIGKGTQAKMLSYLKQLYHVSTGNMFREIAKSDSDLGKLVHELINIQGRLVPDDVTMQAFGEYLGNLQRRFIKPDTHVLLLDGIPRTLMQVEPLEQHARVDGIIYLKTDFDESIDDLTAPEEILTARILKRAQEEGRADDTADKLKGRLAEYKRKTLSVLEAYDKQLIYPVNGFQEVHQVHGDVRAAVSEIMGKIPRFH